MQNRAGTFEASNKKGTPVTGTNEKANHLPEPELSADYLARVELKLDGEPEKPKKETPFDKFRRSILDQTREYSLPVPVVYINQNNEKTPLLTLKSISLWQGKQKSKKTTVLAFCVAAIIRTKPHFTDENGTYLEAAMKGVVLFFDTEQGEGYAARTMRLVLKLAGVELSEKLIYCDLRGFTPGERREIVKAGIENTPDVVMVVIDGLIDLMTDFMDPQEGQFTVTDCANLSSLFNVHIAVVLHQNKADKNSRAHVGTIASQKCEIEITAEVDPNDRAQSIVSCMNSRGLPFEPFAIRWDKGSLPCISQERYSEKLAESKANKNYKEGKEVANTVFKPNYSLSHSEAIEAIGAIIKKGKTTSKTRLEDYQMWGFVIKGEDGRYRININRVKVNLGQKMGQMTQ